MAAAEPPIPATAAAMAKLIAISQPRRRPPAGLAGGSRPVTSRAPLPSSAPVRLRELLTLRTDSGVRTRQARSLCHLYLPSRPTGPGCGNCPAALAEASPIHL